MPSFYVDEIDIDVDEFVSACSIREREQLVESLVDGGYIDPKQTGKELGVRKPNINDEKFWKSIEHLGRCRHLLSLEEEDFINNLAEKFKYLA